jgi:hypothetical protein
LNLEERILILVPTLFFFVTVAWGYLFQKVTYGEIQEADRAHFQNIKKILSPHFHQVTYSDAIFLFMVNGIVWILQFYQLGLGVIVMVTGVVLAVTGLLVSFMWRYERGRSIANWVMLATMIVAALEFIMFIFIP